MSSDLEELAVSWSPFGRGAYFADDEDDGALIALGARMTNTGAFFQTGAGAAPTTEATLTVGASGIYELRNLSAGIIEVEKRDAAGAAIVWGGNAIAGAPNNGNAPTTTFTVGPIAAARPQRVIRFHMELGQQLWFDAPNIQFKLGLVTPDVTPRLSELETRAFSEDVGSLTRKSRRGLAVLTAYKRYLSSRSVAGIGSILSDAWNQSEFATAADYAFFTRDKTTPSHAVFIDFFSKWHPGMPFPDMPVAISGDSKLKLFRAWYAVFSLMVSLIPADVGFHQWYSRELGLTV
jgi:hypothetical protein